MRKFILLVSSLFLVSCAQKKINPHTIPPHDLPIVTPFSRANVCICGPLVVGKNASAFIANKAGAVITTSGDTEYEYLPTITKKFAIKHLEQLLKHVEESPDHALCLLGDVHPIGKYNVVSFIKEVYKAGSGCWEDRDTLLCGPTHHSCFRD